MKPNNDTSLRTAGTLGGKRKAMTLDANSLDRLIWMFTDLYSDLEEVVIREYPINGLDSHRAAGTTRPIEVSLPTFNDPTYVVKDYGTGLSEYEAMEHYGSYGWTSKLETNEQVGMMGLGCKSALTYTKQFALTAVQDGLATEVLVLRAIDEETGREVPSIETVSVTPTNEPNGVTVYIPVDNVASFNRKAHRFFSYWKAGDVLVDGEEPEPPPGRWIDDDVLIQDDRSLVDFNQAGTTVVMGNIPYQISHDYALDGDIFPHAHIVVWVPIGAVDPTPAREALSYTPRTLETLDAAREFLHDRVMREAQERMDACKTSVEAVKLLDKLRSQLKRSRTLTYHGRSIPTHLSAKSGQSMWTYRPNLNLARSEEGRTRYIAYAVNDIYVTGHSTKIVSKRQREKIAGYLDTLPIEDQTRIARKDLVLVADLAWADGWLDGAEIIDWADIEAAEAIKRDAGNPTQNERRYKVLEGGGGVHRGSRVVTMRESELPLDRRLVMASTRASEDDDLRSFRNAMSEADLMVVLMHPRSFGRFKRDFPGSLTPKQAVYRELRDLTRSVPLEQLAVLAARGQMNRAGRQYLTNNLAHHIAGQEVADRELLRVANAFKHVYDTDLRERINRLEAAAVEVGLEWRYIERLRRGVNGRAFRELADRYPLLHLMNSDRVRACDFVEYVNLLYRARQENSP